MKYLDGNQFNSVDSSGNANNIKNVGTLFGKGSAVSLKMAESGSSITNHYFVFRPILRTDIISSNRTADVSFTIKFVGINPSYANAIASCYLQAVKSDGLYNYRAFLSSSDLIIIKDSEFHTLSTQLSEDNANNILAYPYVFPVLRVNLSMIGYIAKDSTVTISEFGFKLL